MWRVERILRHRVVRGGATEYLIKWDGWPDTDNSWEPSDNLANAPDAVEQYLQRGIPPVETEVATAMRSKTRKRKAAVSNAPPPAKKRQCHLDFAEPANALITAGNFRAGAELYVKALKCADTELVRRYYHTKICEARLAAATAEDYQAVIAIVTVYLTECVIGTDDSFLLYWHRAAAFTKLAQFESALRDLETARALQVNHSGDSRLERFIVSVSTSLHRQRSATASQSRQINALSYRRTDRTLFRLDQAESREDEQFYTISTESQCTS